MEIGKAPVEADYTTFASWKQARNAWDSQRRALQRSEANRQKQDAAALHRISRRQGSGMDQRQHDWQSTRAGTMGFINHHLRHLCARSHTRGLAARASSHCGSCRARRKRLLQVEVWVAYGAALTYSLARRHAVSVGSLRAQLACIRIRGFR
jgi:hypothetical protein